MKNLLFITWDGPQTSYMEGLFMPIFHEIAQQADYRFHVIQFTWAEEKKIAAVKKAAGSLGIQYTAFPILKKPVASVGSLLTLFNSASKIKKYIRHHHIDTVMPRSNFPAFMVNRINNQNFKIIFDADGLPIEERVDFAGLKKDSRQYRWLKSIETQMLKKADAVITRSQKSIDIHLKEIGESHRSKFSVVFNGRNADFFQPNTKHRLESRKRLGLTSDELLFVYCGSLGDQYCWEEMAAVVTAYRKTTPAKFLVLTGNTKFALDKISSEEATFITVKSVPFDEIPFWLNAGDVAFALRKPTFSMQGVAPIKLGEYLLCGLPTIASKSIGDSELILEQFEECYLYDHSGDSQIQLKEIKEFSKSSTFADRSIIRSKALDFFSLQAAAESYLKALKKFTDEEMTGQYTGI
ncbi:glycosyltransferase [Kaistella faecalis]|uniref:glycosyltransferase n=1 Tax=Kaistella faecalis TaxID=2852098 RepID=UPI001C4870B6|nr:hypothetical protein [Chryseobacterium faecale]UFK97098.1 hypothetical protein LL667_08975 [Chryseobacterium faecale]